MRLFLAIILLFAINTSAQERFSADSIMAFQREMNLKFIDSLSSPLLPVDRHIFNGLDFYAPDSTYCVKAKLIRSMGEKPFAMATTTSRTPMYIKFGVLHFEIAGQKYQLNVYQNVDMPRNPLYKDYLFLPFTDLTSGVESYGGGRYLDFKIPEDDTLILDFNKAYNPYCAYNPAYSCPIVPAENDLKIEIRAGVKKFKE